MYSYQTAEMYYWQICIYTHAICECKWNKWAKVSGYKYSAHKIDKLKFIWDMNIWEKFLLEKENLFVFHLYDNTIL